MPKNPNFSVNFQSHSVPTERNQNQNPENWFFFDHTNNLLKFENDRRHKILKFHSLPTILKE